MTTPKSTAITSAQQQQHQKASSVEPADVSPKMPYRTDLKRPDLKGQFPCTVCHKIFCHSSSLSRHRMQAHYKCYICTQCNQEIHSSETLRSHMYRCHQIHRMFMCRCCNWAFPDKTSLHIHMQSMQKSGMPGDVSVLARSSLEVSGSGDPEGTHSYGSPSNSSPDEEQQYRGDSISPSISEMEEQQQPHGRSSTLARIKMEESGNNNANMHHHQNHWTHQNITPAAGIFPNQLETSSAEFLLPKFGIKHEMAQAEEKPHHLLQHQLPQLQHPQFAGNLLHPSSTISPAALAHFQQQHQPFVAQLLANNPYLAASALEAAAKGAGTLPGQPQHQQQPGGPINNAKVIQTLCSALATAAAAAAASRANQSSAAAASSHLQNTSNINNLSQHQSAPPPQKKQRKYEKRKTVTNEHLHLPSSGNLSLQIPQQQQQSMMTVSPAMSETSTAGKLNLLISNLLSIRSGGSQNSPTMEDGREDGKSPANSLTMSERKNKRKMRTPTRASGMAEMIYGDEMEDEEADEMPSQSVDIVFPCIQRLMEMEKANQGEDITVDGTQQNNNQQPSPAVSDSQTSGSGGSHKDGDHLDAAGSRLAIHKQCNSCQDFKIKMENNDKIGEPTGLLDVKQIGEIAERIALLAGKIEEKDTKEELLECSHNLQQIVKGQ